jgi:hypothetical protein
LSKELKGLLELCYADGKPGFGEIVELTSAQQALLGHLFPLDHEYLEQPHPFLAELEPSFGSLQRFLLGQTRGLVFRARTGLALQEFVPGLSPSPLGKAPLVSPIFRQFVFEPGVDPLQLLADGFGIPLRGISQASQRFGESLDPFNALDVRFSHGRAGIPRSTPLCG